MTFDREEKKSYQVQIAITDSGIPAMTGTSTLLVTIGDENDNPMKPGFSDIFVYNYKVIYPLESFGINMSGVIVLGNIMDNLSCQT